MNGRIVRPGEPTGLGLPEIGRLHVGLKNERGLPQSIDWFRPTGKYADLFTQALGEKPQTIQIIFTDDNPQRVCDERFEYRDDKGALVAYGDGKNFGVWDGQIYRTLTLDEYPDLMAQVARRYPTKRADNWDVTLRLRFIIPAVRGVVGEWLFTTKGKASSIVNIRDSFDGVQILRGTVTQTVFDLSVQFAKSNKPGVTSRYPVVSLVANDTKIEAIRQAIAPKENLSLLLSGKEK